ncbi:hypothetical protein ACIF6L_34305 [Kitasatospora sp. NPDC086009]
MTPHPPTHPPPKGTLMRNPMDLLYLLGMASPVIVLLVVLLAH